ncbi:hypothetical protein D3C85_1659260 [compost metagenome]
MAVDQHGEQAAIHQPRPTKEGAVRRMAAQQVDTVGVPVTLQVQAAGVGTAAAVADAFGGGQFLQG